ncbi:MAG TPA: LCP family protein [Acidimicrobiales bacterium]|nr:LCP family protein [Acidimicrobiales bacterium]
MRRLVFAVVVLALGMGCVSPSGAYRGEAAMQVVKVDEGRFQPAPGKPVFILVMGQDARPGQTQSRGDALHVVGINPALGKATILNIPRDTWVNVPGRGMDKINAANYYGGPLLQARTVSALVGVDIPFVLTTGFDGLADMVDELGGINVDVPVAMNDVNSGAVFPRGTVRMDGGAALAFARNRNLAGGDFTRSQDQGILMLAGLDKLRDSAPTATNTLKWMAVLARHVRFDGIGLGDLYRLGRLALSIDSDQVRNITMPGTTGSEANQSVVFVGSSAPALFADFRDDAVLQRF